jgi:spermidine/putrescine transport system permease protein
MTPYATTIARRSMAGLFWAAVAVVYLPIVTMVVFSFNSGRYQTLPFREPTLRWYERLAADPQYWTGFVNSLVVAGSASLIATALGFACAYSLVRAQFPGKRFVAALLIAPFAVPLVLVGMSLRIYVLSLGLQPTFALVIVGEVVYVLPLAVMNLRSRLTNIPFSHEEAAWSLGASRLEGIRDVVVPSALPALLATVLLCFTFAFDEFVIAYFLTNFDVLLPIKIWTTLVTGFDPTINAAGTLVFVLSLTLGMTAQWLATRRYPGGRS